MEETLLQHIGLDDALLYVSADSTDFCFFANSQLCSIIFLPLFLFYVVTSLGLLDDCIYRGMFSGFWLVFFSCVELIGQTDPFQGSKHCTH